MFQEFTPQIRPEGCTNYINGQTCCHKRLLAQHIGIVSSLSGGLHNGLGADKPLP